MTKIQVWNEIRKRLQWLESRGFCDLAFEDSEFAPFENITVTEWYVPTGADWGTPAANRMRILFTKVAELLNFFDTYADFTDGDEDGKAYCFKCGNETAFYIQLAPIWL